MQDKQHLQDFYRLLWLCSDLDVCLVLRLRLRQMDLYCVHRGFKWVLMFGLIYLGHCEWQGGGGLPDCGMEELLRGHKESRVKCVGIHDGDCWDLSCLAYLAYLPCVSFSTPANLLFISFDLGIRRWVNIWGVDVKEITIHISAWGNSFLPHKNPDIWCYKSRGTNATIN